MKIVLCGPETGQGFSGRISLLQVLLSNKKANSLLYWAVPQSGYTDVPISFRGGVFYEIRLLAIENERKIRFS